MTDIETLFQYRLEQSEETMIDKEFIECIKNYVNKTPVK